MSIVLSPGFTILYGIEGNYTDVTEMFMYHYKKSHNCKIPMYDHPRSALFGDPLLNVLKHVKVLNDGLSYKIEHTEEKTFDFSKVDQIIQEEKIVMTPDQKLKELHKKIQIKGGSMMDELPEQLLTIEFLNPKANVLEIGGNIGRNSLVIANLLENSKHLVTMESDPNNAKILAENRNLNGFQFGVEDSALSYHKLVQNGWVTKPCDVPSNGWVPVKTMTFEQVEAKYQLTFDTLIADCEGALYYILVDNDKILQNIKMIIIENDFTNYDHKKKVDEIFGKYNFVAVRNVAGGWGACAGCFYQVWTRNE